MALSVNTTSKAPVIKNIIPATVNYASQTSIAANVKAANQRNILNQARSFYPASYSTSSSLHQKTVKPITVIANDVSMRDGIQNKKEVVPTHIKKDFLTSQQKAGFQHLEFGSLVKNVPNVADTEELYKQLPASKTTTYDVLVPNEKGLNRLIPILDKEKKIRVAVFTAASEKFNQKNIGCTVDASLTRFLPVIQQANDLKLPVRAYISCAFGCPFGEEITSEKVITLCKRLLAMSCKEVAISDTIGKGTAKKVAEYIMTLKSEQPLLNLEDNISFHFHGSNLELVDAGVENGVTRYDVDSFGFLGGCPVFKSTQGNMPAELFLNHLNKKGIETGIDLDLVKQAQETLRNNLKAENILQNP